jgi:hypothetical protein
MGEEMRREEVWFSTCCGGAKIEKTHNSARSTWGMNIPHLKLSFGRAEISLIKIIISYIKVKYNY